MALIAIIRIAGMLGKTQKIVETFTRMNLLRKYCCVLIDDKSESMGMLANVRDFVAYGPISEETLVKLLKDRGRIIGDSSARIENPEKIAKELIAGKKLSELKIKSFFRLHPPRKGIDSTLYYGQKKGVLGNNKEDINKLILRMLS